MVTRNVVLTEHQDALVSNLVDTGRFQNASEALRAGLRLLEREETDIVKLGAQLDDAVRQAKAGEFADGTGSEAIRRAFVKARSR